MAVTNVERELGRLAVHAPAALDDWLFSDRGVADSLMRTQGPIGPVVIAFNSVGIAGAAMEKDMEPFLRRHRQRTGHGLFEVEPPARLRSAVERALTTGDGSQLHYDLRALSPFFRAVLQATATIPAGQYRSYSWVAAKAGSERAVRAAGNALAANPIPLLIPCHRVVRGDGRIGNYGMGGPKIKLQLLDLEGVETSVFGLIPGAGGWAGYAKPD